MAGTTNQSGGRAETDETEEAWESGDRMPLNEVAVFFSK